MYKNKSKIRYSRNDRIFLLVIKMILFLVVVIELYPLIFVVSASFSSPEAVQSGKMVLLPVDISMRGYGYVLKYKEIWTGYANAIFYTGVGTLVNIVVTMLAAYALANKKLRHKGFFTAFFMITMYFNGGLIPSYLNVKSLGLLDTRLIIVLAGTLSIYNLIVSRTFYVSTIPYELYEASEIDGCNDFQTLFRIVLPLSKPIIVVLLMYYGVGRWNSYFTEMIYLSNRKLFPLQLILREVLSKTNFAKTAVANSGLSPEDAKYLMAQADMANLVKYCIMVVSTLPIMMVFPFLQKYFEKGIMIGSVKG